MAATPVPFELPSPDQIEGAVAVITGASRGLGAGMATRLGELGFKLGLCARTEPTVPPGVDPSRVVTGAVDVTDAAAVDAFATTVTEQLGSVTLWINNAGLLEPIAPARSADPATVRDTLLVNVLGVMNGSAAFARHVRATPDGRRVLVNISSGAATSVYPGWSTYGPTKAAVEHYSRHVAVEEPDITVAAVAPGVVDTDMQALIRSSSADDFPSVDRFVQLDRDDAWNSPRWIADHLAGLVTGAWVPDDVIVRVPDEPR